MRELAALADHMMVALAQNRGQSDQVRVREIVSDQDLETLVELGLNQQGQPVDGRIPEGGLTTTLESIYVQFFRCVLLGFRMKWATMEVLATNQPALDWLREVQQWRSFHVWRPPNVVPWKSSHGRHFEQPIGQVWYSRILPYHVQRQP